MTTYARAGTLAITKALQDIKNKPSVALPPKKPAVALISGTGNKNIPPPASYVAANAANPNAGYAASFPNVPVANTPPTSQFMPQPQAQRPTFDPVQYREVAPQQGIDEFELMRRRIQGQGAQASDQAQRDLQRKFASLGNLDSGIALNLQQQAAQQAAQATDQQIQDINTLESQTRQQERQAEADRNLQRYGIETTASTARGLGSMQEQGATERALIGANSNERVAMLGNENAYSIAQLEAKTNTDLSRMSLGQAKLLAEWDRDLKQQGLDLQKALTNSSVNQANTESALNVSATFINSLDVLKNAGFDISQMQDVFKAMHIPIDWKFIQPIIDKKMAPPKVATVPNTIAKPPAPNTYVPGNPYQGAYNPNL